MGRQVRYAYDKQLVKNDMLLALSSPPTTSKAASMQHSPAVNTGTLAIPILAHGVVLEPLLHDLLPPDEAGKPPDHHLPKQIQAPNKAGWPLELLPGEALQCAMGQTGLTLAHALEGQMPVGEAHGHPPDLPNLQRQGSIVWEPVFVIPKACVRGHEAWRPVLDEGAQTRPDPWPNLGIVTTNPDTCIGSVSQLEGEQNIHLLYVGSKLHAAPSAPQNSSSSLSPLPRSIAT